jgi:hypothetical protein
MGYLRSSPCELPVVLEYTTEPNSCGRRCLPILAVVWSLVPVGCALCPDRLAVPCAEPLDPIRLQLQLRLQ